MSKEIQLSLGKEQFVADLAKLVSYETLTNNLEEIENAFTFIQEQLHVAAHIEVIDRGKSPILLASNAVTKTPDICYLVHVDVVPAHPHQFNMQIEGDYVIGRGVSDMKFSIPIGYAVLNDLIQEKSDLTFMLAVTSDEEKGGFLGAQYLADDYGLNPKLLIVPDGGDNFVLIDRSKAVSQLTVTAKGTPAHSSRPWLGESALDPMIKLGAKLLEKYEASNRQEGWHTTMNIGILRGGEANNQVPAAAEMKMDFRYPEEHESVDSLFEYVTSEAAQIDSKLVVTQGPIGDPSYVDVNLPALQLFKMIVEDYFQAEMEIDGAHGSSDVRHFTKLGTPFIMTKPEGGDIHGDHEYISISSTLQFYEILRLFIKQYQNI